MLQQASSEDADIVAAFHMLHTGPLIHDKYPTWTSPRPHTVNYERHSASSKIQVRHPFGYTNPTDGVWQAFSRMANGEADRHDEELVDSYAVEKASMGFGLGMAVVTNRSGGESRWQQTRKFRQRLLKKQREKTVEGDDHRLRCIA